MSASGQPAAPTAFRHLRLLTYNIQVGIPTRRYRDYLTHGWKHLLPSPERMGNLDRIAALIADYDIIGLQETDAGSLRSHFLNQTEYLALRAGLPYWNHQTNRRLGHLGQHSLGLIARQPPRELDCVPLPSRVRGRGAMVARFGGSDDEVLVIVTHLALGSRTRLQQMDFLARLVGHHPRAVVMADFNCTPHSPEMRHLIAHTGLRLADGTAPSYPSWKPARPIDHILVTPALSVREARVLPVPYSDHLPVAVEVCLPERCLPHTDHTDRETAP